MKEIRLSEWIGEGFYDIHRDIREGRHTHYWLKGGRGSGKSSFLSLEILLGLIADRDANAVVLRKVAANLRDSVFEQMNWAIHALGVEEEWEKKISPMELIRKGTGQKILFRGCDDPKKLKSIKFQRGYAKFIWYEEADEFGGMAELRSLNQSLLRGGEKFCIFYSYNPPKQGRSWINLETAEERADRLIHHSTYLQMKEKSCGHWAVTALLDGEETETEQHGWGRVPFIPLRNNEKELTDLQLVKGLIDAYDLVSSEGTNNLLDLVDLYWVIQGYGGETASAVAKKLQINKAVQISDSSGNVEAKQVQLPVEGRLDWMQMLRKDIFHFGMGVDTDSDDWGKAASGVALKFQYAMFYLKINGIVPEIKRAVKEFFRFATEDWNRENGTDWDWRKIQITLNTNGITDDMETMQIIAASKGMVSEKTLLGKHPFVEDVNSEMEQLERERKEKDNEIDTDD